MKRALAIPLPRTGPAAIAIPGPWPTVLSLASGLAIWELLGRFVITNPVLFAPFSRVLAAALPLLEGGALWHHIGISMVEFGLGFVIAAAAGVSLGFLLALHRASRALLEPWVAILYSSPLVALMPFFILVFGIGIASKVAIVAAVTVIPIIFNTTSGVRHADPHLLDVAKVYGCTRWQTLTRVLLPAATPAIMVGLRLGVGRGLTGVAVGELFAAQGGLGYLITTAGQSFDTPTLLLGVLIFSLIGVVLIHLLNRLEAWLMRGLARGDAA
ncbi:ABC transporter permease [Achromobacter marplatensis]|uniref:ABC transporter permease n=1 Tax=Achromobacter marplatensis TaxID=470868 RepID=UPI0028EB9D58|nr:ABC transporter permease [Achromobacter marplatensis]